MSLRLTENVKGVGEMLRVDSTADSAEDLGSGFSAHPRGDSSSRGSDASSGLRRQQAHKYLAAERA